MQLLFESLSAEKRTGACAIQPLRIRQESVEREKELEKRNRRERSSLSDKNDKRPWRALTGGPLLYARSLDQAPCFPLTGATSFYGVALSFLVRLTRFPRAETRDTARKRLSST